MSRIFSVLSVFVLVFGLASSAFGLNYHIVSKETPPHDISNRYYTFFSTSDQTQAHLVLPNTLGNFNDPDTRLILHNTDATANATGYGAGPRYIDYGANVTVQSNDPSTARRLSATDTQLFLIYNNWFDHDNWYDDPLGTHTNNGGTLTISPEVLISGSTGSPYDGLISNGYYSYEYNNLGFADGLPFLVPGTILSQTNADGTINVYSFDISSTLNAEGVTFSNNRTVWGSVVSSTGFGSYYAGSGLAADGIVYNFYDTAIALNKLNHAVFSNNVNESGSGGAIGTNQYSFTEANNARFIQNESGNDGGAMSIHRSILYAQGNGTLFSENRAGYNGGAVSSQNSALFLKGADFRDNVAGSHGGAIYFSVDDGFRYNIVVGAYEGTSAEFLRNRDSYGANSIVFGGSSSAPGTASMTVDVDRNAALNMSDPMRVQSGANIDVTIEKTGEGVWSLGGTSDMRAAAIGTHITVREGTFQLTNGAGLNLTNSEGYDSLIFITGTTFMIGDAGIAGVGTTVSTTCLSLVSGTTLQMNNSLLLNLSGDLSLIGSTISGSGGLTKTGEGMLRFSGITDEYSGNVQINQGTFVVEKQFATTGRFEVLGGATLSVIVDAARPAIDARWAGLSETATIEISGLNGQWDNEYVIVKSSTPIVHAAMTMPDIKINGLSWSSGEKPDYLDANFYFRNDDSEFVGTLELSWDNTDPAKRHGTFTVRDSKVGTDFVVGKVLTDKTPGQAWNGQDLTKKGKGTLELSAANTYTGTTTIEEGTLLLTQANATGNGDDPIQIEREGTLSLDFQYGMDRTYDRQIAGSGNVLKQGDSTVALTNTGNTYSGITEIQGGILQFGDDAVFGNSTITFSGGTLQNTSETTLTKYVIVMQNDFARFDVQLDKDLTVSGGISGAGGLVKTGEGTLILAGTNPYQGATRFEEGTVAINRWDSIGLGELVFDGGALQHTGTDIVLPNTVRLNTSGNIVGGPNAGLTLAGTIFGDGALVKNGDASSTVTISEANAYTGGTKIISGTLAIANKESLGSGGVVFAGGTLKNTKEIIGFSRGITINPGVQATFEVDKSDMSIASRIVGNGGLVKTGDAVLTLLGDNAYTGDTIVRAGVLAVDGRINSMVSVERGAALGGTGMIARNVDFQDGSIYRWDFNRTEADSPSLHIAGDVFLKNAYFQPVTAGDTSTYPMDVDGWTVLKYDGRLLGDGQFLIDDSLCPFIDITLDYDSVGSVKLIAHNRYDPRPLSDIMAMSLMMAQRNMSRKPFEQIDNELRHGRYLGSTPVQFPRQPVPVATRGQTRTVSKNLWGGFTGRTSNFASTYYTDDQWRLNSFGVQTGYSFLSTNWISLGVTTGGDLPQLKNGYDKVDGSDGYLGIYYGQRVWGMLELKGFVGGGLQSYKLYRRDAKYTYRADFHGDSFAANVELARPMLFCNWMLRPHIGFDLEYASQAGAVESESSAEFRTYSGTSLTQMFLRFGLDFEKRLEHGEFLFGINYANMIGGQSVPSVYVYYPFAKKGVTSHGAELGHNVVSLNLGGNRYINPARTKALFLDYTADIFCDRAGGASRHSVAVGFTSRF